MTLFKIYNKQFTTFLKDNYLLLIIYIVAIPIITFINFYAYTHSFDQLDLLISLADYYIITGNNIIFYTNLVLIPCLIISNLIKQDFTINFIIRQKKQKRIFIKHSYFVFLITIITTIYQFIITYLIGSSLCSSLINFNQTQTIFWFINQGIVSSISFTKVLIYTCVFCVVGSLLFSIFHLVIKWIFYFDIISYLIIILLALCDIYGGYGICNLYGVYYNKWIDYQAVALLIPALLLSICFVVGLFLSERKELLRAK